MSSYSLTYLFSVSGDGVLANGGRDEAAATMTADRSYTQLSGVAPLTAATESHLGCNGTCSGGGSALPRDASMSTQVVVLSPATPSESETPPATGGEGKRQIHHLFRRLCCQLANRNRWVGCARLGRIMSDTN